MLAFWNITAFRTNTVIYFWSSFLPVWSEANRVDTTKMVSSMTYNVIFPLTLLADRPVNTPWMTEWIEFYNASNELTWGFYTQNWCHVTLSVVFSRSENSAWLPSDFCITQYVDSYSGMNIIVWQLFWPSKNNKQYSPHNTGCTPWYFSIYLFTHQIVQ